MTTLAWKFQNLRDISNGRTDHMAFQNKHYFDDDITIEYFDLLLYVLYHGKKVGLFLDMAPDHCGGKVLVYIKKREEEGSLIIGFIEGGLTSVLQVCDICSNNEFKALIKELYVKWRAKFLKAERAITLNNPNRCINMKIQVTEMTYILEKATKLFNVGQNTSISFKNTFCHGSQDPWKDCEVELKEHLDALSELSLYYNKIKSRTDVRPPADDGDVFNNEYLTINYIYV